MPQQMMWNPVDEKYRGQASDGTVISVDEAAMITAHKRAGRSVYETDWWVETLTYVLAMWGIFGERSYDQTTRVPIANFRSGEPKQNPSISGLQNATGPLSARLNSGPLSSRDLSPRDSNKHTE